MSYEPRQQDIAFLRTLIASPKNVWGIPRTGDKDDPRTCLTYFIDRNNKKFYRVINGLRGNKDHEATVATLAAIGWTMNDNVEMNSRIGMALDAMSVQLLLSGKVPGEIISDMVTTVKGPISWESTPMESHLKAESWLARTGQWVFTTTEFDISTQPGCKEGDRGWNMAMTHVPSLTMIIPDEGSFREEAMDVSRGNANVVAVHKAMMRDLARFMVLRLRIEDAIKKELGLDLRSGLGKTDLPGLHQYGNN